MGVGVGGGGSQGHRSKDPSSELPTSAATAKDGPELSDDQQTKPGAQIEKD